MARRCWISSRRDYHTPKDIAEDYTRLVGPGEGGLQYLEVGILTLLAGRSYSATAEGPETALVLFSGQATVEAGGKQWEGLGARSPLNRALACNGCTLLRGMWMRCSSSRKMMRWRSPGGYHPVVAVPGYKLYYLWALAGEERRMQPHDDPDHEWVSEAW